jgi:protein arginine kinase
MTWYMDRGPDSDVILSSRVRLARNLVGHPFPNRLEKEQAADVSNLVSASFFGETRDRRAEYLDVDLGCLPDEDRMALVEKRLISEDLARFAECRRAIISRDESVSVMVNEEDHIRIQAMSSGFDLNAAYRKAEAVALLLESRLPIAYSGKYGFLTACPTNVGTGMRASVMAHLPGLAMAGLLPRRGRKSRKNGICGPGQLRRTQSGRRASVSDQQPDHTRTRRGRADR